MSQPDTNRNLLFAIMAVQMDFVPRDAIVSTVLDWIGNKEVPLGQVLVERGELSPARRTLLDQLLDEHIKAHAGDPARSLQALSSTDGVADLLTRVPDADLQASLGHLRDKGRTQAGSDAPDDFPTHAPDPRDIPTQAPVDGGSSGAWTGALAPWSGRFRVVRKHAEGGLGVVSLAIDDELDREVAYKEIKPRHADRRTSQARFVMEAEITGKLEHPGIVPIYGLGHDPMGRPYYAMRFIQGDSLAEAINRFHDPDGPFREPGRRALQLRELLGRFLDVCDALAYAHSRGVLHRDLKPGNVMLGPFGETLVVDWGLALNLKEVPSEVESTHALLKTSKADTDSLPSEQGAIVGTLQYMPPEQAEGAIEKLGPRSDVYGLGAILYDLLTGRHPVTGATQPELLQAVREGKITPPRQFQSGIPRPLEAICLKALSLRPEDRYATPRALASDIKSYLADEPVNAYREPVIDRFRRWSRRHRTLVSTLAATLFVGVLGLGSTLAVLRQANQKLSLKNEELVAANNEAIDAVRKFGATIANEPLLKNTTALQDLRKRLLQEPHAFFQSLRKRLQAENDTRPESLARLAHVAYDLGVLTTEIGDKRDAIADHESSLKIYKFLVAQHPTVTKYQSELAASHNSIGILLRATGKTDDALKAWKQALDIRESLAEQNPTVREYQNDLAGSHHNIGVLLSDTGKPDEALKAYQRALDIRKSLAEQDPTVAEFRNDLALTSNSIGVLLSDTGKPDEALKAYQRALDIRKSLAEQNPTIGTYQNNLALTSSSIGNLLRATGKLDEALNAYQQALMTRKSLVEQNPTVTEYQSEFALTYSHIANSLSDKGKKSDAIKAYQQALDIQKSLAEQNPTVTEYLTDLGSSHHNIGIMLHATGKTDNALKAYQRALDIRISLADENPTVTEYQQALARSHHSIGNILSETGKPNDAIKAYQQALEIQKSLAIQNPTVIEYQSDMAASHNNIGVLLNEMGKTADAIKAFQQALNVQKSLAERNPTVTEYQSHLAASYNNIGSLMGDAGKSDEAIKAYRQALEIRETLAKRNPTVTKYQSHLAASHNSIGRLLSATGKMDDALKAYRQALEIRETLAERNHSVPEYQNDLAASHNNLGILLSATGKMDDALKAYRQALEIRETLAKRNPTVTEYQRDLAASHNNIGNLLIVTGKPDDALNAFRLALDIQKRLASEHSKNPEYSSKLGGMLNNLAVINLGANRLTQAREELCEAIVWQKKALATNPANRAFRQFMGNHLQNLRKTYLKLEDRDGVSETELKLKDLADSDPAMTAFDARLGSILKGEQNPKDLDEWVRLAVRSKDKWLHVSSARFWSAILKKNPNLAGSRRSQFPYRAACAAALAGTGHGKDEPMPTEKERAELRGQALVWLKGELDLWESHLVSVQARAMVGKTLLHWTQDTDLAGVREPAALAKLPEAERKGWEELWREVERLRAKAK